jgi:hypothetical protein
MAESKRGRPYVKISGSGGYCEIDVLFVTPRLANTAHSSRVALMGQVSSDEEGPMEGVLVASKKDGSRSSISIFSDYKELLQLPFVEASAWPLWELTALRSTRWHNERDSSGRNFPRFTVNGITAF